MGGVLAGALALAACSSSPSPSASSTTSTTAAAAASSTSTTSAHSTTTTTNSVTTTSGTLTPGGPITEFFAPSKNLQCQIAYQPGGATSANNIFCLTISPPASATLTAQGALSICSSVNCLANAGLNTPTLQYGYSISNGPFTCLSLTTGMKCTLTNGNGFVMAASGVTPIGGVSVTRSNSPPG